METTRPMRVLILEDRPELVEAVKHALGREPRCSLVAVCPTLQAGISTIQRGLQAEVALVDLQLPDGTGHTFLPSLKAALPECSAVIWTQFDDDDNLFEALKQGASGYLLKSTPAAQIVQALLDVSEGGAPMTPAIARRVLASFRPETRAASPLEALSERERTVLKRLSHGYSYAEIAEELGVSLATVQTYIRRTYAKLNVHTKAEATLLATKAGIT
ncbi:MAG: response regulator transcription factor [Myxococcota bacterium]